MNTTTYKVQRGIEVKPATGRFPYERPAQIDWVTEREGLTLAEARRLCRGPALCRIVSSAGNVCRAHAARRRV